jgi:hypothetical protein
VTQKKQPDLAVLELEAYDTTDVNTLRKWAGESIRSGDGLFFEENRLFIVFPAVGVKDLEHALNRLAPEARRLGADLLYRTRGNDDKVVDSLYRRSEALILPVYPRHDG